MTDDDIKKLFERVAKHFEDADEGTQRMFGMLVKTAIVYRDKLVHSSGAALTVEETRRALDAFMKVLQTHDIPKGLDGRVHGLVLMWLEELKEMTHN